MRPEQHLASQQQLRQERSFADVCVPELISLAVPNKASVLKLTANLPRKWPFADKLLVAVFPTFREDVEAFHAGTGKSMTEMFEPHQLLSIDNGARITLLARLVEGPR